VATLDADTFGGPVEHIRAFLRKDLSKSRVPSFYRRALQTGLFLPCYRAYPKVGLNIQWGNLLSRAYLSYASVDLLKTVGAAHSW